MSWMRQALLNVFRLPVKWLVSTKSTPANVEAELGIDKSRPIIYLLPTNSITDQLALQMSAEKLGLPNPMGQVTLAGKDYPASLFLRRTDPLFRKHAKETDIEHVFAELFHIHREHDEIDIQVVPVFVSWGRAPDKGKPGFADLITHVAAPSWFRKFFIVLFLGRDNFISYSKAVSSRVMANQHGSDESVAHKLVRVASTHFQRKRQSMTGPTLLDRQQLNNAILGSESVKRAMAEECRGKNPQNSDRTGATP